MIEKTEMAIWKYPLNTGVQEVPMPSGAEILSAANQSGQLVIWALVVPSKQLLPKTIEVLGTGTPFLSERRRFVGTAIIDKLVWHVFERV